MWLRNTPAVASPGVTKSPNTFSSEMCVRAALLRHSIFAISRCALFCARGYAMEWIADGQDLSAHSLRLARIWRMAESFVTNAIDENVDSARNGGCFWRRVAPTFVAFDSSSACNDSLRRSARGRRRAAS
jgi:hypothetical protein